MLFAEAQGVAIISNNSLVADFAGLVPAALIEGLYDGKEGFHHS